MTTRNNDTKEQTTTQPAEKETTGKGNCPHRHWKALFPCAALLALILASVNFWQMNLSSKLQATQNARIDAVFLSYKADMDKQRREVNQTIQGLNASEQQLQTRVDELNKQLQTALQKKLYQKQDWLLQKAKHYLELAQINIHWTNDPNASIAMLQEADTILRELPDQRLFPVRQSIAAEITQLQAVSSADLAGILSQLDTLKASVDKLPVKTSAMSPVSPDNSSPNTDAQSAWKSKLQDSINALEQLVVIKHHDGEAIEPILSPLYINLLRESVRINLQAAQWAAIHYDSTVFQQALAQAIEDVNRGFDKNNAETQSLINGLQALQKQQFDINKPDITHSLTRLNQLIEAATSGDKAP